MKNTLIIIPVALVLLAGSWHAASLSKNDHERETTNTVSQAEHGAYLVEIMACNDCHTPFKMGPQGLEPDMERMLSGHPESFLMPDPPILDGEAWVWAGAGTNTAFAGPWGVSYALNLTPDPTGLKAWTEEMFVKTLKTGWHMGVEGSRMVQPPMPWPAYSHATVEDLQAIFAYLQTVPPVRNTPPAYRPPSGQ